MPSPKLVTTALILHHDKILLIKRKSEVEGEKWAMPGGTGAFAKYANPLEAVKDEVAYDLNVSFSPKKLVGNYYRENDGPTLTIVYEGVINATPEPNKESVLESRLFSPEEIKKISLAFDHRDILEDYFKQNEFKG